MGGGFFDRIRRALARQVSRRALLAGATGIVAALPGRASANQLTPATCGVAGDVCTHLLGCCDGFTCATSAINVNYGVCIPGDGGMVSVGPTLISPFSENADEQAAALAAENAANDSTTPTTRTRNPRSKSNNKDTTTSSPDTTTDTTTTTTDTTTTGTTTDTTTDTTSTTTNDKKARIAARKTEKRNRRATKRSNRAAQQGPSVALQLFNAGSATEPLETVKVTNGDDVKILVHRIESLTDPNAGTSFPTPIALNPGQSYGFLSDGSADAVPGQFGWTHVPICKPDIAGDGFVIVASFSANQENHEYPLLCDQTATGGSGNTKRKKRKRSSGGGKGGKSRNKKKN